MKFLINLGPNCEDAKVNATSVTEKTVPATPIIALDMVDNMLRAESALFTKKKRPKPSCENSVTSSKDISPIANKMVIKIIKTGTNQKLAFNSLKKNSIFFISVKSSAP